MRRFPIFPNGARVVRDSDPAGEVGTIVGRRNKTCFWVRWDNADGVVARRGIWLRWAKESFKMGERIRMRIPSATPSGWVFGEIVRRHPDDEKIVIRFEDESLRAMPWHRVYKI